MRPRLRLGRAAVLAAALLAPVSAPAAAAPWWEDLDLTLTPRSLDEPLRLAVPGAAPALGSRLLPYLSLGAHGLMDEPADDPARATRHHSLADPGAPRLDVGAGLTLRIFDRLQLFGEYRFFHSRPVGGPGLDPRRESDGPTLRGGISVPF